MSKEAKSVVGSNEHHAEIEQRLEALEGQVDKLKQEQISMGSDFNELRSRVTALESKCNALSDSYHALVAENLRNHPENVRMDRAQS